MLTIQSDNGKQGYKVGGKKYRRPRVVLPRGPCERYSSDWIRRRDQQTSPELAAWGPPVVRESRGSSLPVSVHGLKTVRMG